MVVEGERACLSPVIEDDRVCCVYLCELVLQHVVDKSTLHYFVDDAHVMISDVRSNA